MYVCQNKNHDGDRKIGVDKDHYALGGKVVCSPCFLAMKAPPAPSPKFTELADRNVGLNAYQQGLHVEGS